MDINDKLLAQKET